MKQKQPSNRTGWILMILGCLPFAAATAGSISRVEGTPTNGSVLTITGTGFGAKPNGKPLYFLDYGHTPNSSLARSPYAGATRGTVTSAVTAPGSTTSLRNDVAGITEAFGPTDGIPFSSDVLYVWIKKYYGFNIADESASNGLNLKFFRIWYPWTHDIYTGYQGGSGVNSGRTMPEGTAESSTWWTMPHVSNKWIIDEHEYRAGDLNAANGVFNYTRSGISAYPRSTRFPTRTSAFSGSYNLLFFDQISNNLLTSGKYLYFDSIYVDDTWQRVLISDEPTWQSVVYGSGVERTREIQVPVAWNDTTIQVTVRQGSLGNLAGRYLYVIGADGNPVNQTGFALSGGGGKTPAAPAPLTVQ